MYPRRVLTSMVSALVLIALPGCFLFGGGGGDDAAKNGSAPESAQYDAQASDEAMSLAEMALEENDHETAVAEYNRAIRADSTNVDAYLELTRLHQQLSAQYRESGDVAQALQEQTLALRVLSVYIDRQLTPADSTAGGEAASPDTGVAPVNP